MEAPATLDRTIDREAQLLDLERRDCEESLYDFLKSAWRYMDPSPWRDGWHISAIAEHLQAVVDGDITRLIINVPPRHCKSLLTAVAFPAWCWAQPLKSHTSGPGVPFLYASYADKLSLRDSVKCRRLIESVWYQRLWGERFKLMIDQNTKHRFTTDHGGERLITSIGAGITGEGGNIIVIDDPNAANEVLSEATIQSTIDWWTTAMPTRINDSRLSAFVIIQQRLAENDLTGHIQETESEDWVQLILPGRYEPERAAVTTIGWKDPRSIPGELLWPEKFDEHAIKRLEKRMGPYVFAGQIQQRPEPAGGGIIKRDWWQLWTGKKFPPMDFTLACLDTAYTEDEMNDPSGLLVLGIFSSDELSKYKDETKSRMVRAFGADGQQTYTMHEYSEGSPKAMCMHAWDDRLELHQLVVKVADTCIAMGVNILLIENKASGISVAQEIRRLYANERFSVQLFDPKSQDKAARLYSVQHLFAERLVWGPDRPWMDRVITQVGQFPKGKNDEYVDLISMGLRKLREWGLLCREVEHRADQEARVIYPRGQDQPLYPA